MRRTWTLGGSVAGFVIVGTTALGAGTAAAAPAGAPTDVPTRPAYCVTLPFAAMTLLQKQLCGLVDAAGNVISGGTSAVTGSVQSVAPAVPNAVPQVVQVVPRVVPRLVPQGSTGSGSAGSAPSSGTAGSTASGGSAAPAAGAVPAGATSVAPTQDYGALLSSAYDRVPSSLLGSSPTGGVGGSLIAPAAFDPGSLLNGPGRTLDPSSAANGVTTASRLDPVARPEPDRIGTPLLLGVLALSSVLALVVRAAVLRRARRTPAVG